MCERSEAQLKCNPLSVARCSFVYATEKSLGGTLRCATTVDKRPLRGSAVETHSVSFLQHLVFKNWILDIG